MDKEEFLKLLPILIREDDQVKGAIISALSTVMATKNDIERVIEHSDKRFEAIQKQMDERFERMDERITKINGILISLSESLKAMTENVLNINLKLVQLENLRSTEFKTLDGKIEMLNKGQDYLKDDIKDIKDDIKDVKKILLKNKK